MKGTAVSAESELLSYSTAAILALHWGTLHRTIRTKDAAIAGFGAEQRFTANAFVEELAGVSWHRFAFGEAANRTYQHGFQNKLAHTRLIRETRDRSKITDLDCEMIRSRRTWFERIESVGDGCGLNLCSI
jgi:hypothetical protein